MRDIKLLVWDLDETIWHGIWIYDGERVKVKDLIPEVMQSLDNLGILQSLVTHNEDVDAIETKLKGQGLWHYFLYPQISIAPKSVSLNAIKNALGLSRWDEIAMIDDDEFHLHEIRYQYPDVVILHACEYETLPRLQGFAREQVTDTDRKRRELYRADEKRQEKAEAYDGDYQAFLKSLNMQATIRVMTEDDAPRVHQLMKRTNQFNSAVRVLLPEELVDLMSVELQWAWVMELKDDIGDYGIVGFMLAIESEDYWLITDMTVSCRVAGRGLGTAMVINLMNLAKKSKVQKDIRASYKQTKHNHRLAELYEFLGFIPWDTGRGWQGTRGFYWASYRPLKKGFPHWLEVHQPVDSYPRSYNYDLKATEL